MSVANHAGLDHVCRISRECRCLRRQSRTPTLAVSRFCDCVSRRLGAAHAATPCDFIKRAQSILTQAEGSRRCCRHQRQCRAPRYSRLAIERRHEDAEDRSFGPVARASRPAMAYVDAPDSAVIETARCWAPSPRGVANGRVADRPIASVAPVL
jgi:hypothetical protein